MRVIFFDIDGTLIRSAGAGKLALAKALQEPAFDVEDPNVDIDFGGRTDLSICKELFEINKIPYSESLQQEFFNTYLKHLESRLSEMTCGTVLPGVSDLLDQLMEVPNTFVGIITGNLEKGAFLKLAHFGLDHFFTFGGFGDNHEARSKIAEEGFERAQAIVGRPLSTDQVTVIGDTDKDVFCARAIGARAIAVKNGFGSVASLEKAQPDHLLDDLGHTESVLELLLQGS